MFSVSANSCMGTELVGDDDEDTFFELCISSAAWGGFSSDDVEGIVEIWLILFGFVEFLEGGNTECIGTKEEDIWRLDLTLRAVESSNTPRSKVPTTPQG